MFLQLPGVDMVVQKGSLSLVEFGNELLAALAAKQPYILPGFTVWARALYAAERAPGLAAV